MFDMGLKILYHEYVNVLDDYATTHCLYIICIKIVWKLCSKKIDR
jgi:hypothetical protein